MAENVGGDEAGGAPSEDLGEEAKGLDGGHLSVLEPQVAEGVDVFVGEADVVEEGGDVAHEGDLLCAEVEEDVVEGLDEIWTAQHLVVE